MAQQNQLRRDLAACRTIGCDFEPRTNPHTGKPYWFCLSCRIINSQRAKRYYEEKKNALLR